MFKISITVLLAFLLNIASGQVDLRLTGMVAITNNKPIAIANVVLYSSLDSAQIKGVMSDESGAYELNDIKPGNYFIKVRYIGFQTSQTSPFRLINTDLNLDTI